MPMADIYSALPVWDVRRPANLKIIMPDSKENAAKMWRETMEIMADDGDVAIVYTDGSKLEEGGVGAAAIMLGDGAWQCAWSLPVYASIYQAEAIAIKNAIAILSTQHRRIHIMTDSLSVLSALNNYGNRKPQHITRLLWMQIRYLLDSNQLDAVTLQWIPGHYDIPGNDMADALAKDAAKSKTMPVLRMNPSLQMLHRQLWNEIWTSWAIAWGKIKSPRYIPKALPTELELKRFHASLTLPQSSIFAQFRSGHTHLNASRNRFHRNISALCKCGRVETLKHFFLDCAHYDDLRAQLRSRFMEVTNHARLTINMLLDSSLLCRDVIDFIQRASKRREEL
jgi:ribonuclease HI